MSTQIPTTPKMLPAKPSAVRGAVLKLTLLLSVASMACSGHPLSTQTDCGNGVVDNTEECDGNDLGGETCASLGWEGGALGCTDACTFETASCEGAGPQCGNSKVEYGEECDATDLDGSSCVSLGFAQGDLACTSLCTFDTSSCSNAGSCGDGVLDPGEECDATNLDDQTCQSLGWDGGDLACNSSCHFVVTNCQGSGPVCGNSVQELGELCDGTDLDGQTCADLGYTGGDLACDATCAFDESGCTSASCGDGMVNQPTEDCDGADLGGQTCADLGYTGGDLACDATCAFDESACITFFPICGDGTVNQQVEECDGADLDGTTCQDLGFSGGILACDTSCTFDTSGCTGNPPYCGDGTVNQGSEQCDGADLDGTTCQDLGYFGGALSCTNLCEFDVSSCMGGGATCGDGVVNQNWEECDGSDLDGASCTDLGFAGGTLGCDSSCFYDVSSCTGGPTCSSTGGSIPCNGAVSGTNVGAPSQVDYWYSCVSWTLDGPEVVYTFTANGLPGQNVTVTLSGLADDLDMMVLSATNGTSCDPGLACPAGFSGNPGTNPEQISFTTMPGSVYYIVVDGWNEATSSYSLTVSCN